VSLIGSLAGDFVGFRRRVKRLRAPRGVTPSDFPGCSFLTVGATPSVSGQGKESLGRLLSVTGYRLKRAQKRRQSAVFPFVSEAEKVRHSACEGHIWRAEVMPIEEEIFRDLH
jgi:hypothetical protein